MADAGDLKSSAERLAGSNPAAPTIQFTEVPAAGFEPEGRDAQRRGLRPQAEAWEPCRRQGGNPAAPTSKNSGPEKFSGPRFILRFFHFNPCRMINPPAPEAIPTRTPHVAYRIHPVYKSCHPDQGYCSHNPAAIPTRAPFPAPRLSSRPRALCARVEGSLTITARKSSFRAVSCHNQSCIFNLWNQFGKHAAERLTRIFSFFLHHVFQAIHSCRSAVIIHISCNHMISKNNVSQ